MATAEAAPPAEKPKRAKIEKVAYPIPEGGLTAWPADFSAMKNKPLTKKDFADETVYLLGKADKLEKTASRLRQEAAELKALGNVADRDKAKKLLAMQRKFKDLQDSLTADGVDVSAILATLGG